MSRLRAQSNQSELKAKSLRLALSDSWPTSKCFMPYFLGKGSREYCTAGAIYIQADDGFLTFNLTIMLNLINNN